MKSDYILFHKNLYKNVKKEKNYYKYYHISS